MLITNAILLFAFAALLKGLRHPFYLTHLIIVLGLSWLIQNTIGNPPEMFSPKALQNFLILHLLSITILTFIAYGWDKRAAQYGNWRIPERTLHAFSLLGGTLGAIAGQKIFRHKTRKNSFRLWFLLTLMAQIGLLLFLFAIA